MPTRKLSEHNFDRILGRALRSSSQPVPGDFTERMLERIRRAQEQRILARVVLQERLALTGCIVLVVAALAAVAVFPDAIAELFQSAAGDFSEQGRTFIYKIPHAIEAVRGQWQSYAVVAGVLGFAAYGFVGLLLGDRFRLA